MNLRDKQLAYEHQCDRLPSGPADPARDEDEREPADEPDYEDRPSNEMMEHYKRGGR